MNKERRNKVIRFSLFIIIIILILLLRSCMSFDKINELTPTGNIDIYDITINKGCCEEGCECKCNTEDVFVPEKDPYEDIDGAFIYDKRAGLYENSTKLNIFTNPAYEFKSIIAPESSNVYQFIVRNNNDFNIEYNLIVTEDNEYNINMKYRLKMDGKYVNDTEDNWVTYEELHLENLKLASKSKNVYQLEWKWFESDNDTYIGEIGADYSLKISFDGVEV